MVQTLDSIPLDPPRSEFLQTDATKGFVNFFADYPDNKKSTFAANTIFMYILIFKAVTPRKKKKTRFSTFLSDKII